MKAIITVDVPEHQIGQEVSVYFKDTMCVNGTCESETEVYAKHDEEVIKETVASVWGKPCADAVSRQAVKNEIMCWIGSGEYRYAMSERFLFDRINELPPVYLQNTEVLDSIQAEIEEQIERDFAFAKTEEVKVPVHYGTANGLQVAVRIINKYRKGQTDADSD